jgi:hypothetical protein
MVTTMSDNKPKTQPHKFKEAARELETDDDEKRLMRGSRGGEA